ncbi:MAG: hypothetical protein F9K46_18700 [Anaerolineae bacterium]|nr:MAG: hypothetical protein F9K46_18700 [Anaerolineae bacterium]
MTFKGHTVIFSPDELLLASASKDGTVRFWNMDTAMLVGMIDLNDAGANPVWDVDFSADGTLVGTASEDGFVRLWGTRP